MQKRTFAIGVPWPVLLLMCSFYLMNLGTFLSCCCGAFAETKGRQRRKLSHAKGENPGLEQYDNYIEKGSQGVEGEK